VRYCNRLIGLALCLTLVWASLTALPSFASDVSAKEVTAVVAAKDIYEGTRIAREHLKTVSVGADLLPKGAISDVERVLALYARVDIFDGQYITEDMVAATMQDYGGGAEALRELEAKNDSYLCVTDYVAPNTGEDLADVLQSLILANPNRTICFPDGEYLISHSLTTPAAAAHSVTLRLSDGAVIKARGDWREVGGHNSLIALGGAEAANDVRSIGSYYLLTGGMLDGSGLADGVSIASGRESVIRNICIKDARTGIYVDFGANNTSSDCDFEDITIIGSGEKGSKGVVVIGADNTFTNIRIYDMETGFIGSGGGHVNSIFIVNTDPERMYTGTVGVLRTGAFMSNCYIENYETAFAHVGAVWDCNVVWNNDACKRQVAFHNYGGNYALIGVRVRYHEVEGAYTAFTSGFDVKTDCLLGVSFDEARVTDTSYKEILDTPVVQGK